MKKTKIYLSGIIILMALLMISGISAAGRDSRKYEAFSVKPLASSAPGYCNSGGGSTTYEYISSVSYNHNPTSTMTITVNVYITNACGCTYGEPCGCYDNSPEYVNVWVDWDGDKVFESGEKVIDDALTGYVNINYGGSMTSSHVVTVPTDAVNYTWMRANLGWSYDPNDPCEYSWTYGNVVDKEIGTPIPPEIEDINVTGPEGNESYPMTTKTTKFEAIIKESQDYEIYSILWWGDVELASGTLETHNPYTDVIAGGKHGKNKIVMAKIFYRNKQTGEEGTHTYTKFFDLFFVKYGDDDGDGEPNWFEYWKRDGAVPDMGDANYDATSDAYGYAKSNGDVYLTPYAAGQHYVNSIVINTHFGEESFGGPDVQGSDCAAEIIAHELYHVWVDDQWNASGEFFNKTDSDKYYKSAERDSDGNWRWFNDELPDSYETGTSHTTPINETDTYDLETNKHSDYKFYGDQEYMAMRTGDGARGVANKDWANPGKQTAGDGAAASVSTLALADTVGFAKGELTGNFVDSGNDNDGDSLYDYLEVKAELNVTNSGLFRVVTFLIDSNGTNITYLNTQLTLSSGLQNITLQFEGKNIRTHGVNGPYTVNITVSDEEGNTLSKGNHTTSSYSSTNFDMSSAGITGSYSETTLDLDSDGIYDYLTINVETNVTDSGTYTLEGWLYDSNGEDIAYASNSQSLTTGIQSLKLNFSGTAIGNHRVNGAYTLEYLKLTNNAGKQLDFVGEAYNTSAYSYTDFKEEKGGAKLGGNYDDYGSDLNADGLYDYLIIKVGVNVSKAGNYTLSGVLYDSNNTNISTISVESAFSSGSNNMTLNFEGEDVYNNGVDGPYTLKYLALQNKNGTQADYIEQAHNTVAYNYTDFMIQPLVSLSGTYTDQGLDVNNNSLYDHLAINIGVQVDSDGNVIVSARLMDSSDNEIEWVSNTSYLYANQSNTMVLEFNGTKINENLVNGPYYLKDLYIYHTGDPDKSVYLENAYTTSTYSYTDFEGGGSGLGDANGDNLVGIIDLGMLGQAWQTLEGDDNYNFNVDFDNDDDVDLFDLALLGQNWGNIY